MIKNRNGTVFIKHLQAKAKQKTFDSNTSITNYVCLFCNKSLLVTNNIHEAKCSCGSQWIEKKKSKKVKVCEAV